MITSVDRLADAGLLDPRHLNDEELRLINDLSEQETTTLIQVASRLYPEGRQLVKVADMQSGRIRICVPL